MQDPRNQPSSLLIRKACKDDEAEILACLAAAFAPYRSEYTPDAFADTVMDAATIKRRIREMRVIIAISKEQIVGTIGCGVNGEEGHLRGMAVLPRWQGTALASLLLQAAEAEIRNAGCKYVTLDTTLPLQRAIRFYQRHGFVASGRVSDFFGMQLFEYRKLL